MSWETVPTVLACLRIFASLGGTASVSDFGRQRWPDSPNWRRSPGKMVKAAAGMCGRLCRRGVLQPVARSIYTITDWGRAWLMNSGPPPVASATPWVPGAPYPPMSWALAPMPAPAPHPVQPWPPTMPHAAPVSPQAPLPSPQFPQLPPAPPLTPSPAPWPWPPWVRRP